MLIVAAASFTRPRLARNGTAQAISSGIAFGLAAIFTKAMTDTFEASSTQLVVRVVTDPWIYAMVAANLCGMIMLQNSFHQARGIITMPLSGALSNLVPIVGGMLAFGERLPADPLAADDAYRGFCVDHRGEHDPRNHGRREARKRTGAPRQNCRSRRLTSAPAVSKLFRFETN